MHVNFKGKLGCYSCKRSWQPDKKKQCVSSAACRETLPYATEGEKFLPLPGEEGLLRGGLYADTQLGENFGLVLGGRAGLKLSTFCPCRGDDWEATGDSFFSGFWGGDAWIPANMTCTVYKAGKTFDRLNGKNLWPFLMLKLDFSMWNLVWLIKFVNLVLLMSKMCK